MTRKNGGPAAALSRSISAIDAYRQAKDLDIRPGERVTVLPKWAIAPAIRNPHMHPVHIQWAEGRVLRSVPETLSWYGTAGRKSSTGMCALVDIIKGERMQVELIWGEPATRTSLASIEANYNAAMLHLFGAIERLLVSFVCHFDAQRLNELLESGFLSGGQVMGALDVEVAVSKWMVGASQNHSGGAPRWESLIDRLTKLDYLGKIDSPYLWLSRELSRTSRRIVSTVYDEPPIAEQIRRLRSIFDSGLVGAETPEVVREQFQSFVRSALPKEGVGAKRIKNSLEPTTTPSVVGYDEFDEHQFDQTAPDVRPGHEENVAESTDWRGEHGAVLAN